MKLFNTLTRHVDDIIPLAPPQVTVYTCGPTVYDYAHIGHWFNYVRMDTLIRALKAHDFSPLWVMNITDVGHLVSDADEGEDKLEKGARREGKTAWEVAEFYTADFLECMRLLSISTPDHITKATDHIAEQIELIRALESKGYTYRTDDGIYYDTSRFEGYAAFARLDLDDQQSSDRTIVTTRKRQPSDFALWKFSPADHHRDMEWDSPWGKGFPGWHIECSAMSMKYLGETLDIHTGGIDHIPVHHTNEIAQSEAVTGKRFAQMWMHSSHVMVNGEKISKSLGNGIRLQEIIEKGYAPDVIRLHILESHYRSQAHFSWLGLDAAKARLTGLRSGVAQRWQTDPNVQRHAEQLSASIFDIEVAIGTDLNTPQVLQIVNQMLGMIDSEGLHPDDLDAFTDWLTQVDQLTGLHMSDLSDISPDQKSLIQQRRDARLKKDWHLADEMRDALENQGVIVRDVADRTIWQYA